MIWYLIEISQSGCQNRSYMICLRWYCPTPALLETRKRNRISDTASVWLESVERMWYLQWPELGDAIRGVWEYQVRVPRYSPYMYTCIIIGLCGMRHATGHIFTINKKNKLYDRIKYLVNRPWFQYILMIISCLSYLCYCIIYFARDEEHFYLFFAVFDTNRMIFSLIDHKLFKGKSNHFSLKVYISFALVNFFSNIIVIPNDFILCSLLWESTFNVTVIWH